MALYVDDCFVDCHDPEALDYFQKKITEKYGGCTRTNGNELPFVGMLFDLTQPGVVRVDMPKYIEDAISGLESATPAETPAALDLFAVDESAESLATPAKDDFHSRVAKLLYLAERTRYPPTDQLPVHPNVETNRAGLEEIDESLQIPAWNQGFMHLFASR